MSRRESKVDLTIDNKYSSGDSNILSQYSEHEKTCKEENNNEIINELSQKVSKMGCIMDGVKRPPNICVETCIYESESEQSNEEEVNYSDEFEEDGSDKEADDEKQNGEEKPQSEDEEKITDLNIKSLSPEQSTVKLSKSHSFMSSKASVSGNSSTFASVASSNRSRRVNMSFSNDRLRDIERQNHVLLNKIMSARNYRKSSIPPPAEAEPSRRPLPPAAVNRKKEQQRIDHENMILLKKLQRAKSSAYSIRR